MAEGSASHEAGAADEAGTAGGRLSRRTFLKGSAAVGSTLWAPAAARPAAGASDATDRPAGGSDGDVFVCPTSHLDWDWKNTFTEYVAIGPEDDGAYAGGASTVLGGVCELLGREPAFRFSLAEVSYLRAYLTDDPASLPLLVEAGPARFALLGGGITSPDNLVCHGEVFIRNYLLGRRWVDSVGLGANLTPVAWLPDDFGHDPQLPVALAAMGLQWLGLSRVPGSSQPFASIPLGGGASVAAELGAEGLVFAWEASDQSQILAHFMPATYGAVFYGSDTGALATLVESGLRGWPTVDGKPLLFAPAGGDFALSEWDVHGNSGNWLTVVAAYNAARKAGDATAVVRTFPQFMARVAPFRGEARSPLLAQNYWTGIFCSRPALKTLHCRAAQLALAAEAAASLLRLTSSYSTTVLDDLDAAVDRVWEALVPSSHHDYITGTSPDRVYWVEQLPLLQQAARLGEQCLTRAVGLIAAAVTAGSTTASTSVVVFNPLGFRRSGVVELPPPSSPGGVAHAAIGSTVAPVQRLEDGGLLFQIPAGAEVGGFGYTTVALAAGAEPPPPRPPRPSGTVTLKNDMIEATIERASAWAVTSFATGEARLLPAKGLGNSIRLYEDTGNLYQFGNEPLTGPGKYGTFADSGTTLVGGEGEWVEAGPIRWHFRGPVSGTYDGREGKQPVSYAVDYILHADEGLLRMRLTGAAPPATTVVAAFDLTPPTRGAAHGLVYGTAHHFDDHEPVPYWHGPTFRSTHNFVQTTGTSGPGLAIYHEGVPAWSIDDDRLLGALLRNTNGTQRGAAGTDPGVHTQEYALGPADRSPVGSGEALRTALGAANPLFVAVVGPDRPTENSIGLPEQAALATVTSTGGDGPPGAVLRAARTQAGHTTVTLPGYYAERFSFILRVYVPDPASAAGGVTVTLPSIPDPGISGYDPHLTAEVVSALEEPVSGAPAVRVSRGASSGGTVSYTVTFAPRRALTTLRLSAIRSPTVPTTGKPGLESGPPPHVD